MYSQTANSFVYSNEAEKFNCAICKHVMRLPTNIGCGNHHLYCKQCILKYVESFDSALATIPCPICKNASPINNHHVDKFVDRIIDSLQIKCIHSCCNNNNYTPSKTAAPSSDEKELEDNDENDENDENVDNSNANSKKRKIDEICENKDDNAPPIKKRKIEIDNNDDNNCEWIGNYHDLQPHLENNCLYHLVECKFCNEQCRRKQLESHYVSCQKFEIECPNKCGSLVARSCIKYHINHVCSQTLISCNTKNCTLKIRRCELLQHMKIECEYRILQCPFKVYGCKFESVRKDFNKHLDEENKDIKIKHLELKCNHLENQMKIIQQKQDQTNFTISRLQNTVSLVQWNQEESRIIH